MNEAEPVIITHPVQIRHIPGIGQQIETKHLVVGLPMEHMPHVRGTDKTGGASDQDSHGYSPPPTLACSLSVSNSAPSTGTYSLIASRQSRGAIPNSAARILRKVLSAGRRAGNGKRAKNASVETGFTCSGSNPASLAVSRASPNRLTRP